MCGSGHIGPDLGYCPDRASRSEVGVCGWPAQDQSSHRERAGNTMRFERSHSRKAAVVAVAGSLALLASACGGDDGGTGGTDGGGAKLEGRGPITFATGKDTSGNLTNQVAAWNSQHPDEK